MLLLVGRYLLIGYLLTNLFFDIYSFLYLKNYTLFDENEPMVMF